MEQLYNDKDVQAKIALYGERIFSENKKFNLTGYKTLAEVKSNLIDGSYRDLQLVMKSVPRGTLEDNNTPLQVADLGTGSGVPGVVLALTHPHYHFTLLDSNGKKCQFIEQNCKELGIDNVTVVNCRIEEYSREQRDSFDLVISRAFGPLYYSFEFGLSLLKEMGHLFIYSHYHYSGLSTQLTTFCEQLGGGGLPTPYDEGVYVQKLGHTPSKYPRKFPVVKRESKKIPEVK